MGFHVALFLILSFSSTSFGVITISTSGTGASNVLAPTVAGAGPSFYYSNPSGIPDPTTPTNWGAGTGGQGSCAGPPLLVNPNCRDTTQLLTLTVSDTVATTASNATFYIKYVTTGTTLTPPTTAPGIAFGSIGIATPVLTIGPYTTNQAAVGSVSFGTICSFLAQDATLGISNQCVATTPGTPVVATLYIFADANGDGYWTPGEDYLTFTFTVQSEVPINSSIENAIGFYSWQAVPGDGQVTINQPLPVGTGVVGAYAVNFYYVTSPNSVYSSTFASTAQPVFNTINNDGSEPSATTAFSQLLLNADGSFSNNVITGLNNGTNYYFRASIVDAAGNNGYIELGTSGDDLPANPPLPFQWHAALPDQIAGLLSKNGECFIATAAYGTPMAKQVQILREFRDKILLKSSNGKKFVYWYYKNGNTLAEIIRNRDDLKAVVRTFLYPVIGYGWLALKIGAFNAALLISTLLMLPLLIIQLRRSRKTLENMT
jgi:hypothetical protein